MIEKKKSKHKLIIFLAEILVGVALYMLFIEFIWPMISG